MLAGAALAICEAEDPATAMARIVNVGITMPMPDGVRMLMMFLGGGVWMDG